MTASIVDKIGADRTAIRLSPVSSLNDVFDSNPTGIFFPLVRELSRFGLAYVHVIEGHTGGPREFNGFDFQALRASFNGPWIVNNGYTRDMAIDAVASGYADLVAFGRLYLSNPDLVERLRLDAPLSDVNWDNVYGGEVAGYTDYPALESA